MSYVEQPPRLELADEILCVWTHRIDTERADSGHRILPDGCVDIVWLDEAPPVVVGPMTTGRVVQLNPGTWVTGVRLRPGAAQAWFDISASELVDREVDLADLWGRRADDLHDEIREPRFFRSKTAGIDMRLAQNKPVATGIDPRLTFAINQLAANPSIQIEAIATQTGLSDRQLRRLFLEAVGYGPKTLARIIRLQRAVAMFDQHEISERSLAGIASMAGYADQAHFTREVQRLTGAAPTVALPGSWCAIEAMSESFKTFADC